MAATGTVTTAHQRRSFYWLGPGTVLCGIAVVVLLGVVEVDYAAAKPSQQNDISICKSVDIRNTLDTFKRLEGCRVVEGFVQILLFDNVNETQLAQISFPELTEITDYLLLYRVNGLRSLEQLFPNLSVIRGQAPFFTYALVVYEMFSLQEIALYSLTDITHGLIMIDKNPSLCYVNTINWDIIARERGHFIKNFKPPNECPICPGDEKPSEDEYGNTIVPLSCPKGHHKLNDIDGRDLQLCWNRQHCQKICPSDCPKACNKNGTCCSDNCLGGCSLENPSACTVCRNVSIEFEKSKQCMSRCPDQYYEYLERRCVKREDCVKMRKPIDLHSRSDLEFPYKIFNNSCVLQCPTNYVNDFDQHICKPCGGQCKKECAGVNVDSISSARQLRGCTHITGSLEIQLRGGTNVVNELEENLSMIEDINGYLKIVRSFPLVSLNFFKSLKRIRGNHLESQKNVFVVLDNQNLQDIWNWENRTLKIDKGRLFFHFNPKLCLKKIEELAEKANLTNFTDVEVAFNSNGDKIACDLEELNVTVVSENIGSKGVVLEWEQFKMKDQRKLLAYIVHIIEAEHQNVTLYDGRDACREDKWWVEDVAITDDEQKITHPLTKLKPYTQYAFYVRTYTIVTDHRNSQDAQGAQSNIQYFRTLPFVPSPPLNLKVTSNASDSLTFTWRPPSSPNGNVTLYIISGKKHIEHELNNIDYCNTPTASPKHSIIQPSQASKNENNDTCPCDDQKASTKSFNDAEELARIQFENDLQNEVYIRRQNIQSRRKRDTSNKRFPADAKKSFNSNNNEITNSTEPESNTWKSFSFKIYGKTKFHMNNLHHFTYYDIYVQACREREGKYDNESNCSNTIIQTVRTLFKEGADNIGQVTVTNNSLDMVSITWNEPEDPNGAIYSYSIKYKQLDNENSKSTVECIPHSQYLSQNRIYVLKHLAPGNYSLKVLVTTSAGDGQYSPAIQFYIHSRDNNVGIIVGVVCFLIFIMLMLGGFLYWRKRITDENMKLITEINPEYTVYVPDDWEVPRKKIELLRELGQGSFGMVYEGEARDIRGKTVIKCAVKTVNEHATARERLEFLNEASVMKAFDTTHVVRLLGVVSQGQPTLVIMELMARGDLKTFLRSHRPDAEMDPDSVRPPHTLKQILQKAIEIADGMAYLAAKKFVHRDLAARNCMVADDLTVKIGDFGMTRDIYETDYYRKGTKGLLPVRWMAPESLKDGVFTSNSDVWSYGVVLWEMATLASQPYQGLSNDQVLRYVIDGGVMERPENCPDKLYTLMRYCWQHKPTGRPSFLKLCALLLEDAAKTFSQVSFYHSTAGVEARSLRPAPSPCQDDPSTPLRADADHDANFSLNSDDSDDDFVNKVDTLKYSSIPIDVKEGITAGNGYISGCPTNGAATTQC